MAASAQPATTDRSPALPLPLQKDEELLQVCRRHWMYLWPMMIVRVLIAIVPVVVVGLLLDGFGELDGTVGQIFVVLAIAWPAFWLLKAFLAWYHYHNDTWFITNQRLIDSYRKHPFTVRISTTDLVNVEDMTVERSGIIASTFDFGDITCQTASVDHDFHITGIPDPRGTQALVDRERDRERMRVRGL